MSTLNIKQEDIKLLQYNREVGGWCQLSLLVLAVSH